MLNTLHHAACTNIYHMQAHGSGGPRVAMAQPITSGMCTRVLRVMTQPVMTVHMLQSGVGTSVIASLATTNQTRRDMPHLRMSYDPRLLICRIIHHTPSTRQHDMTTPQLGSWRFMGCAGNAIVGQSPTPLVFMA